MITKEQFKKLFPTFDSFKQAFPIGKIFKYYDRNYYEIRGYLEDKFPDGEDVALITLRTYKTYKDDHGKKIKYWSYYTKEINDFYNVYEFCKKEFKKDFEKSNWDKVKQ